MKSFLKKVFITIAFTGSIALILVSIPSNNKIDNSNVIVQTSVASFASSYKDVNDFNIEKEKEKELEELRKTYVYEELNMDQLVNMLNKSLNSTISNKGKLIAEYSLKNGVDPVVATAIMLLETGCKWQCSYLVKKCNNVGGIKGSPSCNGGYKKYNNIDDGIKKFIKNLGDNYYSKGLDTPEKMNKKYASSSKWAKKVNKYIKEIKNN